MTEKNKHLIPVQIDTIPNILKMPNQQEKVKNMLRQKYEQKLDDMLSRYTQLPAIMIQLGKYTELLLEARDLYIEGRFYSCIAMCGVTAERIAKELLRKSVLFRRENKVFPPSEELSKLLERIDMETIRELLIKSEIIDSSLRKSFQKLGKLRNDYVHARGKDPQKDSEKAIKYLHEIIEGTVSIFKDYEIQRGEFIKRQNSV